MPMFVAALRVGAHAICEQQLLMNPWSLDVVQELEAEYGRKVNTALQLRVPQRLLEPRERLRQDGGRRYSVRLTYVASRGTWYRYSWTGDPHRSGGVAKDIEIHFFDLLTRLIGNVTRSGVHLSEDARIRGYFVLQDAGVEWFLSPDQNDLPAHTPSLEAPDLNVSQISGT